MDKVNEYRLLVEKRKACCLCRGLSNPATVADGRWDSREIGPWSLWQANLDSEVVIVGQDWGDVSYFLQWEGRDQPGGNPTNENLQTLLREIGVEIRKPRDPQNQVVFFTNLILCLKTGGLQERVEDQWFRNCSSHFLRQLLHVIRPRVVIALGKKVSESIFASYGVPHSKSAAFSATLEQSPYELTGSTVLFPLYHCGAGSVNRNRSMVEQTRDWARVNVWLQAHRLR